MFSFFIRDGHNNANSEGQFEEPNSLLQPDDKQLPSDIVMAKD